MKTVSQKHREKRDQKIYKAYTRLINQPGAMVTACEDLVGRKFGVSRSKVQSIKKRMSHGQPV